MTFRPDRGRGVTIGVLVSGWLLALGIGVVVRASGGDVTLGAFLLYVMGGALALLGVAFTYWTYSCATMSYRVDDALLRVRWGLHRVTIPLTAVDVVAPAPAPERVGGLNWPGHHVGRAVLQETAPASVFATEFAGGEAVYVRARELILALTPHDAKGFIETVEARRRTAPTLVVQPSSSWFDPLSFVADRSARAMVAVAVALNAAAFGVLSARYDDLPETMAVDYPVGRDAAHIVQRDDLFAMPITAVALLGLNLVLGVLLHRRQRALAQTILGGSVFLEGVLIVAALAAVD